jgi:aminodeoxyfutalosine deaminase
MRQSITSPWTLTARWIFPVSGPPLSNGLVTIDGERLASVDAHGSRHADLDLGNVAVLPGLVNAHTHLDLTGLRGLVPPRADFTSWLRAVIRHRREQTREQIDADIRTGLAESVAYGTTLLGDIAAGGQSWNVLADAPIRAVVFYELLGLTPARARQSWHSARQWLRDHQATATCRPGLSPHAPYSVHHRLFRHTANFSRRHHLPIMTHLAETPAEIELLAARRGPFVDFLSELGVWHPRGVVNSPDDVVSAYRHVTALFAHGNYLPPHAHFGPGNTVVYCPRTHAAFGPPPHPFREFLAAGVHAALGTDSLASNPDFDILGEIRFLRRHYPDVPGPQLLRMGTLAGAEALGWKSETGSLEAGKSADLIVLPLPDRDGTDPHELVLDSDLPVQCVMCRGRWIAGG